MIRLIALTFMLLVCATGFAPAQAQDVLGLPSTDGRGNELLKTDEVLRTQYANQYYNRCAIQRTPGISGAAQDETCMCHTVHMVEHLRTEELQLMGTGKGPVSVNNKRLFTQVYAPCMEFVVSEIEEKACYDVTRVKDAVRTKEQYEATCMCVGQNIARSLRETASIQMEAMMVRNPGITDATQAIMSSPEYSRERATIISQCLRTYVK
ncbi:MAG: hypothetical protein KJ667_00505 [Alphaproteobacteria bacterium]|nr:hypothetical protein [Alphaproteobacteria bacterium]